MARRKMRRPSATSGKSIGSSKPRLLHVDWELGQPLPLPLCTPYATGLGELPRLIDGAVWVQAIAGEIEQHGVRYVFDRMALANAALGADLIRHSDEEIAIMEQEMQQEGIMAWWEDFLAQLEQRLGTAPEPEPLPLGSEGNAQYVTTNRHILAAYAWLGFLRAGRGLVVVFQNPPGGPDTPIPPTGNRVRAMAYVPLQLAERVPVEWPGESERMVKAYDPEAGFVVVVESPKRSEATILRLRSVPTPPQAYEIYREILPTLELSGRPSM